MAARAATATARVVLLNMMNKSLLCKRINDFNIRPVSREFFLKRNSTNTYAVPFASDEIQLQTPTANFASSQLQRVRLVWSGLLGGLKRRF